MSYNRKRQQLHPIGLLSLFIFERRAFMQPLHPEYAEPTETTHTLENKHLPLGQRLRTHFSLDWVTRDTRLLLAARAFMSAGRALAGIIVPIYLALIWLQRIDAGSSFCCGRYYIGCIERHYWPAIRPLRAQTVHRCFAVVCRAGGVRLCVFARRGNPICFRCTWLIQSRRM